MFCDLSNANRQGIVLTPCLTRMCSGQQCFERYPPVQAAVLLSWRLLRCNPLHLNGCGFGVDEPAWPPVAYWTGSGRIRTFVDDERSRRRAAGLDDDDRIGDDPLGLWDDKQS